MSVLETFRRLIIGDKQGGNYAEIDHQGIHRYGCTQLSGVEFYLENPGQVTLTNADEYYSIPLDWALALPCRFKNGGSTLTYMGPGERFTMIGVCDFEVSQACKTTHGLHLNGVIGARGETPHTFTSNAKVSNISIVGFGDFSFEDILEVKIKSDTPGTVVTLSTLRTVFIGG